MIPILAFFCSLALAGCAQASPRSEVSPPASSSASTPTQDPTPTPASAPQLTITLDGIVYAHDNTTKLYPLSDGQQVVELFKTVTGVTPAGEMIPQPYTTDVPYITRYTWGGALVSVYVDGGSSDIRITAPALNGVPIKTEEGIAVGSTQADVVTAHGWNARPGFTDTFGLATREVPGTTSLMHDGAVGIDYIGLFMKNGNVDQIVITANDYGDL